MVRSAYPDAIPSGTSVTIDTQTYADYLRTHSSLDRLVQGIVPVLTGLPAETLDELGYAVIDDATGETHIFVPPAELAQPARS